MEIKIRNNVMRIGTTAIIEIVGGIPPYDVKVLSGGAGGVLTAIDVGKYYYTAPSIIPNDPRYAMDTIEATGHDGETAELQVDILIVEQLVADIIQKELELDDDQVIIGNERFDPPNDNRLYATVLLSDGKPLSNRNKNEAVGDDLVEVQGITMREMLTINIMSSSIEALSKRYEVVMALKSNYAKRSMEANSFSIGQIPTTMANVSELEGASIPYKFNISTFVTFAIQKVKAVEFFDQHNYDLTINK